MTHLSEEQLAVKAVELMKIVGVGEIYVHYRSPDRPYQVISVGFYEENEEPCVVYKALYGKELVWIRPITSFLEQVEYQGEQIQRFRRR